MSLYKNNKNNIHLFKHNKTSNFISPVKNTYKFKVRLKENKKNIKDVIKESINLPMQLLPTVYDSFANCVLFGCVLFGCVLFGCVLFGCVLFGCVLFGCVLFGCVLFGCVLFGCVLFGCVLFGCVLFGCVLFGCVLFGCVLFGCVLFGCVLFGCVLFCPVLFCPVLCCPVLCCPGIRAFPQNSLTCEIKNGKKNKTNLKNDNLLKKENLLKNKTNLKKENLLQINEYTKSESFSKKKKKKNNKKYILSKLYNKLINKIKIIHDGPPYANNDIHIGHILNKIIKDIYLKFFLLKNFFVLLIHGFDSHGLPIEYNVMKLLKIKNIKDINLNDYPFNKIGSPDIYTNSPTDIFSKIRTLVKKKKINNLFYEKLFQKCTSMISQSEDVVMKKKIDNFKKLCKLYSSYFINKQFISLISYGIWGYWNYSYITFYKFYEQIQTNVFEKLLKKVT
ncbi:isoleucyl-tRNA syntehtase-related [Plasmodium yoelii yoelii]|uniref:Isoleucyl-tRNA syntehtase-related n=1 Tax=Plasmodium yoelii yoelii TaxID=73239 RepID=Q7R852_PLAYO|nr:isoleucyl-tRNA syntehtase-related [Plasmodium yoelii yoelii]